MLSEFCLCSNQRQKEVNTQFNFLGALRRTRYSKSQHEYKRVPQRNTLKISDFDKIFMVYEGHEG